MSDYVIRLYQPGDEYGIVRLLNDVFHGWPKLDLRCSSIDHWVWKYLDNPLHMIFVSVALKDGEIIGCMHNVMNRVKIRDDYYVSSIVADLAVHRDHRGAGLYNGMKEKLNEKWLEIDDYLNYWMTGNPVLIEKHRSIYPAFPHNPTNLVKIDDIDLHLQKMPRKNSYITKMGYKILDAINTLKSFFMETPTIGNKIELEEIEEFGAEIDDFCEKVMSKHDLIIERNRVYLNWRYCDPRAGGFTVKEAKREGTVVGYNILRINRYNREYPVGYIVDLLALQKEMEAANRLVKDAVKYFKGKTNLINYLIIKNHQYKELLNKTGFLDSRVRVNLFYYAEGIKEKIVETCENQPEKIHFSWGDHDSLPIQVH